MGAMTAHRPARARWCQAALLLGTLGCSAADNLTYGEITAELDGIVRIDGTGSERRLTYAEHAPTSAWYMRSPLTWPLRGVLGATFGVRSDRQLENPSGHVRELLIELPDETGADLAVCSDAVVRFGTIAELDPSAGNRITAIDGACQVLAGLGITLFEGPHEQIGALADPTRLAAARTLTQQARPGKRDAGAWNAAQREAYANALRALVERQLNTASERLDLIGYLVQLRYLEPDAELHPVLDGCVHRALQHCVEWTLLRAVRGREQRYAEVRVCAMQQVRRFAGTRAAALLLAVMAATADQVAGGEKKFDPEAMVQLELIHLCGQVHGELALKSVRLPGRQAWEATAPADFLANTILREDDFYSQLRVPALTALSLCLDRPKLDYDLAWVEAWWDTRRRQS
jgi:hypothetical protein